MFYKLLLLVTDFKIAYNFYINCSGNQTAKKRSCRCNERINEVSKRETNRWYAANM